MKNTLAITFMLTIAFGSGVSIAMAYSVHGIDDPTKSFGETVGIWWDGPNEAILDVDGCYLGGAMGEILNEIYLCVTETEGGLASDAPGTNRAEIMLDRAGTGTSSADDEASAWMKGSGGGEVRADETGDVIFTIGG